MARSSVKQSACRWIVVASVAFSVAPAFAQVIRAPLDRGFVKTTSISMSVDEMLGPQKERAADEPILGPGYPALQIAEVQYKPLRYVRMPVTDPATGEVRRELVWYMVWRMIVRDYTELAGDGQADLLEKLNDPNRDPVNSSDALRARSIQIPRFVLQTNDQGAEQSYVDEVNLEIQQTVFRREFRKEAAGLTLLNNVEAISEFSEPVSISEQDPLSRALYGVAVWRDVDPRTDFLTVYMSGFSNAYRVSMDADTGDRVVEQKVVIQKFDRPGDEFRQDEAEFRVTGNPVWAYRPVKVTLDVPQLDTVLRNAQTDDSGDAVSQ